MTKDRKDFSFEKMIKNLRKAIDKFPDKRRGKDKQYKILIKVGLLLERHDNIEEIDINPLMVSKKSISAVDCRIILKH